MRDPYRLRGNVSHAQDPRALSSVVAQHEHSHLSDKYTFLPTTQVLDMLEREGWSPVSAQQINVRNPLRDGFQKHLLRFRQKNAQPINGLYPEVVAANSHDGSAVFSFMAGLFRLVCANGLIVSEGMFGAIKIKHVNFNRDEVMEAIGSIVNSTPQMVERIGVYNHLTLEPEEQLIFAESAINMKHHIEGHRLPAPAYGSNVLYEAGERVFDLSRLLQPIRESDRPKTLWNTFNTIQEKMTKGAHYEHNEQNHYRRDKKVRGIGSINENVRVNRELWGMMEKLAQYKNN